MSDYQLWEPEEVILDVKKRLLYTDNGETWLLAKDENGELFVEHCRGADTNGDDDIRTFSLVDFLAGQAGMPAARELTRLVGLIVDDAAATSETS